MRGRPAHKSEKYMFISDHQIPYQDDRALSIVNQVMANFKPDKLFIVGDFMDFTKVSTHPATPKNKVSLKEEIEIGRRVLAEHLKVARRANKDVDVTWLYGNHEDRLEKYLAREAGEIEDLEVEGEYTNSIEHLFSLKKLGVKWLPYKAKYLLHGISIEHGSFVSQKAVQTAFKHVERRGRSVIHGHTHRGGLGFRRLGDEQLFGMELGCLCRLNPTYSFEPDWSHGFGVAYFQKETNKLYPVYIPILNYSCVFEGKLYEG